MKVKGGERMKFGGPGRKEDGNCRRTLKIQKVKLFARKFRPLYCKYLHEE